MIGHVHPVARALARLTTLDGSQSATLAARLPAALSDRDADPDAEVGAPDLGGPTIREKIRRKHSERNSRSRVAAFSGTDYRGSRSISASA